MSSSDLFPAFFPWEGVEGEAELLDTVGSRDVGNREGRQNDDWNFCIRFGFQIENSFPRNPPGKYCQKKFVDNTFSFCTWAQVS